MTDLSKCTREELIEELARRDGVPKGETYSAEHDTRIRKEERERVFIELKKDLEARIISSNNQWSKGRNSGLLECCNIIDEYMREVQQ